MALPTKRRIVPGSLNIEQVFELEAGDRIELRSMRGASSGVDTTIKAIVSRVDGEKLYYYPDYCRDYEMYHYHTDSGLVPYKGEGRWNDTWSIHLIEKKQKPIVVKFFGRYITLLPVNDEPTTELSVKDCKHRHVYREGNDTFVCLVTASYPSGDNLPVFIFADDGAGDADNFYCPGSNPWLKNLILIGKLPTN